MKKKKKKKPGGGKEAKKARQKKKKKPTMHPMSQALPMMVEYHLEKKRYELVRLQLEVQGLYVKINHFSSNHLSFKLLEINFQFALQFSRLPQKRNPLVLVHKLNLQVDLLKKNLAPTRNEKQKESKA